jgi:hypothetical protein
MSDFQNTKVYIMRLFPGILSLLILMVSCNNQPEEQPTETVGNKVESEIMRFVTVKKVIQTPTYTYLEVNESEKDYWVAIAKQDIQEGNTFFYSDALEMKDFYSKTLDRTFGSVLFIDEINKTGSQMKEGHSNLPSSNPQMNMQNPHSVQHSGRIPISRKPSISIDPAEGGIRIAHLYSNAEKYKDKKVKVKGQVVKVNNRIMGRNWVHIQDGTSVNNKFDLTVTTSDFVNEGDVVTFSGTIHLEKDFGSGYYYPVIMEHDQAGD